MPEIVRFYGIIIKMFFKPKEHEPAHIHALYNENVGVFDIHTFEMTEGDMPLRCTATGQRMACKAPRRTLGDVADSKYYQTSTLKIANDTKNKIFRSQRELPVTGNFR